MELCININWKKARNNSAIWLNESRFAQPIDIFLT